MLPSNYTQTPLSELFSREPATYTGGVLKQVDPGIASASIGTRRIYREIDNQEPTLFSKNMDGTNDRWQITTEIKIKSGGSSGITRGWECVRKDDTIKIGAQEIIGGEKTEVNEVNGVTSVTFMPFMSARIKHPLIYEPFNNSLFVGQVKENNGESALKVVKCIAPGTEKKITDGTTHWQGTKMIIQPDGTTVASTGRFVTSDKIGMDVLNNEGAVITNGTVVEIPLYSDPKDTTPQKDLVGIQFTPDKNKTV